MALRFNPPPNWPAPPEGFVPPPGWQPDPAWGPAPEGWQVWIDDAAPVSERLLNEVKAGPYLTRHWQTRLLHLAGALHARRQREARDPSRAVAGLPL